MGHIFFAFKPPYFVRLFFCLFLTELDRLVQHLAFDVDVSVIICKDANLNGFLLEVICMTT